MRLGKGAAIAAVLVLLLVLAGAGGVWWLRAQAQPAAEVQVARVNLGGAVADGDSPTLPSLSPVQPSGLDPAQVEKAPGESTASSPPKRSPMGGGEALGRPGSETAAAEVGEDSPEAENPHAAAGDDKGEKKEFERDYTPLLKKPATLGFHPDEALFRNVYYNIRQSFVEPVTDEQLFQGMVKEVRLLLKQAKLPADDLAGLDKTKNVLHQLVALYGGRVDRDLLVFAAIQGMLQGLKDPYSLLMSPEEYGQLQEQVQNKGFGGIGIYIELDKDAGNQLTVFEPIEGTPAAKSGVESGDRILAINGKSTKGITLDGAQTQIRGPVGSRVVLTVSRKGQPRPLDISITRGNIHVVSATGKMLPDKIGYVRLRQFGTLTGQELEAEVSKLRSQGARALILDLRNNGGGYIDAAVNVVGQFTSPGSLVVYTLNRQKDRRDYNSSVRASFDMPLVVLINRYSASASEITAGALRDHKVAVLVGEKSFGKGSVQQLYPFEDDSALKLTIARFYSPAGHVIDHKGIVPEHVVDMEPRFVGKVDVDTQLQKATRVLKSQLTSR